MELSARESLTCALPRVRERTNQLRRHRHDFLGGTMTKRNRAFFEEGTLEAMARLREQDDGFCQKLRIAVEMGMESCPTCKHGTMHEASHLELHAAELIRRYWASCTRWPNSLYPFHLRHGGAILL